MKKIVVLTCFTLLFYHSASAVVCSITTSGLNFGIYDPFQATPNDTNSDITVTCDGRARGDIKITPGNVASCSVDREMLFSTSVLRYDLYRNANRNAGRKWCTDGSINQRRGFNIRNTSGGSQTRVVYGRIFPLQTTVIPGTYLDNLTVTITF